MLHCLSNPRGEVPCPFSGPSIAREVYNGAGLVAEAPVRAEAAPTLSCDEALVTVAKVPGHELTWSAEGCGRAAVCEVPAQGEIRCEGGGAGRPPTR